MISWERGIVRIIRDWWNSTYEIDRPYAISRLNPRWWFGQRWFIVEDHGNFACDPTFVFYTHKQLAWRNLNEAFGD